MSRPVNARKSSRNFGVSICRAGRQDGLDRMINVVQKTWKKMTSAAQAGAPAFPPGPGERARARRAQEADGNPGPFASAAPTPSGQSAKSATSAWQIHP
jgi:hypothetical protein